MSKAAATNWKRKLIFLSFETFMAILLCMIFKTTSWCGNSTNYFLYKNWLDGVYANIFRLLQSRPTLLGWNSWKWRIMLPIKESISESKIGVQSRKLVWRNLRKFVWIKLTLTLTNFTFCDKIEKDTIVDKYICKILYFDRICQKSLPPLFTHMKLCVIRRIPIGLKLSLMAKCSN